MRGWTKVKTWNRNDGGELTWGRGISACRRWKQYVTLFWGEDIFKRSLRDCFQSKLPHRVEVDFPLGRNSPRFLLQLVGLFPTQKRHRSLEGGWLKKLHWYISQVVLWCHPKGRSVVFNEQFHPHQSTTSPGWDLYNPLLEWLYATIVRFL